MEERIGETIVMFPLGKDTEEENWRSADLKKKNKNQGITIPGGLVKHRLLGPIPKALSLVVLGGA